MPSCSVDIVADIQRRIADKVGAQRYKVWFKDTTELTLCDSTLRVGVPNHFVGEWIEGHFVDHIGQAASETVGRDIRVSFSIDPNLAEQQRRAQLDGQATQIEKHATLPARQRQNTSRSRKLRYSLDSFVVGESNELAYKAASSVVEQVRSCFNPLFVHGGCGLGKTHLLQGLCRALSQRHPSARWAYVSGEEFTNAYVTSIRTGSVDGFRQRFRNVDVLVIDDVHFLASKKATQVEFLHTFNAIDSAGKQVVMASDTHPRLIGHFMDQLVNRFLSGMVVQIDPPTLDMRCEILRRRSRDMGQQLPEPIVRHLAEAMTSNIRELEGSLLKLIAYSSLTDQPLTLGLVRQVLDEHMTRTGTLSVVGDIESVVASYFGLTVAQLHASNKTRTVATARAIAMFLARRHTSLSFPEIGRFMGKKNHSTVVQACKRIERLLEHEGNITWMVGSESRSKPVRTVVEAIERQVSR